MMGPESGNALPDVDPGSGNVPVAQSGLDLFHGHVPIQVVVGGKGPPEGMAGEPHGGLRQYRPESERCKGTISFVP